jgi:hypothetical protein
MVKFWLSNADGIRLIHSADIDVACDAITSSTADARTPSIRQTFRAPPNRSKALESESLPTIVAPNRVRVDRAEVMLPMHMESHPNESLRLLKWPIVTDPAVTANANDMVP